MNWSSAALAIVGLLIANAPASTYAQTKWQDAPSVQKLYEAAKKEGQVIVWGPHPLEVEWIPAAFGKMFAGIGVKFLGDNDVGTKAIAEYRAGRHQIDVFMTSYTAGRSLLERNMYKRVDWSDYGLSADDVVFDGRAVLTHNLVFSVVYNTQLVKPEDLPKAWTDLLNPKYKDKMVASSFLLPRLMGYLGVAWGEERMMQFTRDLLQTGILLTRAPPESFLQSGERPYAVGNFESQVQMWRRNGLPADFVVLEPFVVPQFYAAVMEKAPHPNAALLLARYLTSQEGKRDAEAHNFQGDYRKGSSHRVARMIAKSDAIVVHDSIEDMPRRDALIAKASAIIAGQAR